MQCDLCQRASLLRRRRAILCPRCYAYAERHFYQDIANDPHEQGNAARRARKQIRKLTRLIVELNQQPAAAQQKETAAA